MPGERWSAPALWGRALRKQQWRSEEQRRVQGCRRLVHPGRGCLPERRLWPGSGRSTSHTLLCAQRLQEGWPRPGYFRAGHGGPAGSREPGSASSLILSEHKSRPPTSPNSTPYPHLWAATVPAGAGLGAHALAAVLPWPGPAQGPPGGQPSSPPLQWSSLSVRAQSLPQKPEGLSSGSGCELL